MFANYHENSLDASVVISKPYKVYSIKVYCPYYNKERRTTYRNFLGFILFSRENRYKFWIQPWYKMHKHKARHVSKL